MAGQIAGMLNTPMSCQEIVEKLIRGAAQVMETRTVRFGKEG